LSGGLISYQAVASTAIQRRVFESVLPGVLGRYDFADLVAAVAPRAVTLIDVRTPLGNTAPLKEVRETYGSSAHVRIVLRREDELLDAVYPQLLDAKP
jgi:hypothetical protein